MTGSVGQSVAESPAPLRVRALLRLFVVTGALVLACVIALLMGLIGSGHAGMAASPAVRADALARWNAGHQRLSAATAAFATAATTCKKSSDRLKCLEAADRQVARAYEQFAATGRSIPLPAGSLSLAARQVENAATHTALAFGPLDTVSSLAQYHDLVVDSPIQADVIDVEHSFGYLEFLLRVRGGAS